MDDVYRSLPNGQHCTHYAGDTTDALRDVEAWYKKQMPNAKTDDVNKDSAYAPIQLDGIICTQNSRDVVGCPSFQPD